METMTITLTPDIARVLTEHARRQGTTPERIARECLRERFLPSIMTEIPPTDQGTLADLLADHIGVISSSEHVPGGAQMSENTGKKFSAGLMKKRQEGRL
jgi:hypothetical protein